MAGTRDVEEEIEEGIEIEKRIRGMDEGGAGVEEPYMRGKGREQETTTSEWWPFPLRALLRLASPSSI